MGPSLARMAKRAADASGVLRRVIAVSRFSDARILSQLNAAGVETIPPTSWKRVRSPLFRMP